FPSYSVPRLGRAACAHDAERLSRYPSADRAIAPHPRKTSPPCSKGATPADVFPEAPLSSEQGRCPRAPPALKPLRSSPPLVLRPVPRSKFPALPPPT